MTTSYTHDMARVVTGEAARLKQFLSSMTPQDWASDSACQGWIVEDVVAHLAGSSVNWARTITRALDGDAGPPPGGAFLAPGERASHPSGPEIRLARQETRDELLANFISGHEHLANVLAGVKEEDWEKPCFHRRGPLPMWQYLGVQLQELTLHGWDIRSGLDPSAELWDEPLAQLIGMTPRWLRSAFMANQDMPTPVRYRFDISSPVEVREDILVTGPEYRINPSGAEPANAILRGDTGNYLLLIFGRLNVEQAVAAGRLTVEGSLDEAKTFNAWFPGF
jgi:uncharacterized protein (TIGR03083 family)